MGERGSGRKSLEERHKRELRRHRTDELRAGLGALAAAYRDELVRGSSRPAEAVAAVHAVHDALEALERNPNEALLLQALLLALPAGAGERAMSARPRARRHRCRRHADRPRLRAQRTAP